MIIVAETKTKIVLLHGGCEVASVPKEEIEDFTTGNDGDNGVIDFELKTIPPIRFAFPSGIQFDNAIKKLIQITDRIGV